MSIQHAEGGGHIGRTDGARWPSHAPPASCSVSTAEHSIPPAAAADSWTFQELQAGSAQPNQLSPAAEAASSEWSFVELPAQAQPEAAIAAPSGAGGGQPTAPAPPAAANATGQPNLGRAAPLALIEPGRERKWLEAQVNAAPAPSA